MAPTTYFLPQDEILLWKGNVDFKLADGEKTTDIFDLDGVASYILYTAGNAAATWKLEEEIAGQWVEFANGSLVALQVLALYDIGPVPPHIRLKLTPIANGKFYAAVKVYQDKTVETTIKDPIDLPTLPWAATSVIYLAVGVSSSILTTPVTTHIINSAGADNMNADITTVAYPISDYIHTAWDISIDNDNHAVGYIYIQVSDGGIKWDNVTFNDGSYRIAVVDGVDVTENLNLDLNNRYVRLFFDRTGGNGQLDVWLTRKQ